VGTGESWTQLKKEKKMSRERELRDEIDRLERDLRDPYIQDKWVEQEAIKRYKEELDSLNRK
jgi:hypothetical protein